MRARTGHHYSANFFVRAFPFSMAIIRNCSKTLSWIAGVSESDDTLVTFFERIGAALKVLEGIKAGYLRSSEQSPPLGRPPMSRPLFIRENLQEFPNERLGSFSVSCNQCASGGE